MGANGRNLAVIGAQWGDEGKGKIVDLLCDRFEIVARYQGGHNAGHTVKFADKHYSLHLIPSGILHEDKLCVLGNGMVIDPRALKSEIDKLQSLGVVIGENLMISDSAHVILPWHTSLDVAREEAAGAAKIGTTGRGIGPAYEWKVGRYGVLTRDLLDERILRSKLEATAAEFNALLAGLYKKDPVDPGPVAEDLLKFGQLFEDQITDVSVVLRDAFRAGRPVMFEGAQGTLLDVDHGTYPYVTSSNTVVGGVCTGLGVPPSQVHAVLGVAKAYSTRVGEGPFPTELKNEVGERLRKRGNEFGTTTGRPRRTGWLDLVALRTAVMLNGLSAIALTKLDVFDEFAEIPVCTSYAAGATEWTTYPKAAIDRGACKPVYKMMKGWQKPTVAVRRMEDLPSEARRYIEFIEGELECPVAIVSTGPRREETIVRDEILAEIAAPLASSR